MPAGDRPRPIRSLRKAATPSVAKRSSAVRISITSPARAVPRWAARSQHAWRTTQSAETMEASLDSVSILQQRWALMTLSCSCAGALRGQTDIGQNILHPVQSEAMGIFEVKREYGRDFTLCGGLRAQTCFFAQHPMTCAR